MTIAALAGGSVNTRSGVSFAHFLSSLGVQGPFEFAPPPVKYKHPNRPIPQPSRPGQRAATAK